MTPDLSNCSRTVLIQSKELVRQKPPAQLICQNATINEYGCMTIVGDRQLSNKNTELILKLSLQKDDRVFLCCNRVSAIIAALILHKPGDLEVHILRSNYSTLKWGEQWTHILNEVMLWSNIKDIRILNTSDRIDSNDNGPAVAALTLDGRVLFTGQQLYDISPKDWGEITVLHHVDPLVATDSKGNVYSESSKILTDTKDWINISKIYLMRERLVGFTAEGGIYLSNAEHNDELPSSFRAVKILPTHSFIAAVDNESSVAVITPQETRVYIRAEQVYLKDGACIILAKGKLYFYPPYVDRDTGYLYFIKRCDNYCWSPPNIRNEWEDLAPENGTGKPDNIPVQNEPEIKAFAVCRNENGTHTSVLLDERGDVYTSESLAEYESIIEEYEDDQTDENIEAFSYSISKPEPVCKNVIHVAEEGNCIVAYINNKAI